MLELVKKDSVLYVKVLMNLRIPVKYQNKVFDKKEQTLLLLPEEVNFILARNGNIKLWNGNKFVKLNLGEFYDVIQNNKFKVVEFVQPKVEQPKKEEVKVVEQPKKEQPVVQPKVEQPKKEQPVVQPKVEQPKKEESVVKDNEHKQNDNKKQRHNNNKPQQNGGGDK